MTGDRGRYFLVRDMSSHASTRVQRKLRPTNDWQVVLENGARPQRRARPRSYAELSVETFLANRSVLLDAARGGLLSFFDEQERPIAANDLGQFAVYALEDQSAPQDRELPPGTPVSDDGQTSTLLVGERPPGDPSPDGSSTSPDPESQDGPPPASATGDGLLTGDPSGFSTTVAEGGTELQTTVQEEVPSPAPAVPQSSSKKQRRTRAA